MASVKSSDHGSGPASAAGPGLPLCCVRWDKCIWVMTLFVFPVFSQVRNLWIFTMYNFKAERSCVLLMLLSLLLLLLLRNPNRSRWWWQETHPVTSILILPRPFTPIFASSAAMMTCADSLPNLWIKSWVLSFLCSRTSICSGQNATLVVAAVCVCVCPFRASSAAKTVLLPCQFYVWKSEIGIISADRKRKRKWPRNLEGGNRRHWHLWISGLATKLVVEQLMHQKCVKVRSGSCFDRRMQFFPTLASNSIVS